VVYGSKLAFGTILGLYCYKWYSVKSEFRVACAVICNLVGWDCV